MNMYSRSALQKYFLTRNFPICSIYTHEISRSTVYVHTLIIITMPTTQGKRPTYVYRKGWTLFAVTDPKFHMVLVLKTCNYVLSTYV